MAFIKAVKFIIGGIAKICSYLFVTLGLWLPTVFTIAFFVICGLTDTYLSKGIMAVFYVGLGFTALSGLALAMYTSAKRKKKVADTPAINTRAEKKKRKKSEQSEQTVDNRNMQGQMPNPNAYGYYGDPRYTYGNGYQGMYNSQSAPYQANYPPPPASGMQSYGYPPQGEYSQPAQQPPNAYGNGNYSYAASRRDNSDLERKYFSEGTSSGGASLNYGNTYEKEESPAEYARTKSFTEEVPPPQDKLERSELWRRLSGADVPDEQPLVFRTRADEDLYVYEYSDRCQYWRRTKAGMVLERTEYKKRNAYSDSGKKKSR